ncbi:MAG: hypothetical protein ACLGIC_08460 [Acidimicrobiia bacterium]
MRSWLGRRRWMVLGAVAAAVVGVAVVRGHHTERLPSSAVLHADVSTET